MPSHLFRDTLSTAAVTTFNIELGVRKFRILGLSVHTSVTLFPAVKFSKVTRGEGKESVIANKTGSPDGTSTGGSVTWDGVRTANGELFTLRVIVNALNAEDIEGEINYEVIE